MDRLYLAKGNEGSRRRLEPSLHFFGSFTYTYTYLSLRMATTTNNDSTLSSTIPTTTTTRQHATTITKDDKWRMKILVMMTQPWRRTWRRPPPPIHSHVTTTPYVNDTKWLQELETLRLELLVCFSYLSLLTFILKGAFMATSSPSDDDDNDDERGRGRRILGD
jgi:hypothetical protein